MEVASVIISVLLLEISSLVVDNTFSASVALVISEFRLEIIVASAFLRLVVSVVILVARISSAFVALVISAVNAVEPVVEDESI